MNYFSRKPVEIPKDYAIDEAGSNISYGQAESMLLEELGLPGDIRNMKLGHAVYLCHYLGKNSRAALNSRDIELIESKGYAWRNEPSASGAFPEKSLYMDAIARLNEIYDKLVREENVNG